jgi:hypothetical protein
MQMSIYIENWRSTNILENCVLKSLFFQSRKWYIFGMCLILMFDWNELEFICIVLHGNNIMTKLKRG